MYTHVLFDLDGTLTDSSRCITHCTGRTFEHHAIEVPEESRIVALMGVPLERSLGMLHPAALDPVLCAEMITTYRRIYAEVAPTMVRVFAGIPELLRDLRGRNVRTAIVTSKKSTPAEADTRNVGIRDLFHVLVGSDHVRNHKPHPEPALHAMKLLGSDPGLQAVVVGDSVFDLQMGKAAGLRTCAVTWGAHGRDQLLAAGPDHVAESVDSLADVLRAR